MQETWVQSLGWEDPLDTCLGGLTDFFTEEYMDEMGKCFEVK